MNRLVPAAAAAVALLLVVALATGLLAGHEAEGPAAPPLSASASPSPDDAPPGAPATDRPPRSSTPSAPAPAQADPDRGRANRPLALPGWVDEVDPAVLLGRVVDPDGRPVEGARVRPRHGPGGPLDGVNVHRTDRDGRFRFRPDAGPGDYAIQVRPPEGARRIVPGTTGFPLRVVVGPAGEVAGRCLTEDGRPVPARVTGVADEIEVEVRTGEDGRFRIGSLPAGLLTLRAVPDASSPGRPAGAEAVVRPGETARVTLRHPAGATLRGQVVDRADRPVEGVRLLVAGPGAPPGETRSTSSGPEGAFSIGGLGPGEAVLLAEGEDGSAGPLVVPVPHGLDPEPVRLVLHPDPVLRGRVLDADGRPVPGALCRLEADPLAPTGSGGGTATTGEDGRFRIAETGPGEWILSCRAPGRAPAEVPVRLEAGEPPRPLEVRLPRAAVVAGTVRGPDGTPAADVPVTIEGSRRTLVRTDGEGRLRCGGLVPGPVVVRARDDRTGPARADLEAEAGATTRVELELAPPARIAGRVLGPGGRPVGGATVRAGGPATDRVTATDHEGRFRLDHLGEGPFLVEASAPGHRTARRDGVASGESVELTLEPEVAVVGRVLGPGGEPLHAFTAGPAGGEPEPFSDGRFALTVPSAVESILVRARALAPARVEVPPGGGRVEVTLEAGEEVEGRVVDGEGHPVAGAVLRAGHVADEMAGAGTAGVRELGATHGDGRFHLRGVPSDGLDLTVFHPDHAPLHATVRPGEEPSLALRPGARITGRCLDEAGRPAPGIPVVAQGPSVARTTTDADGRFTLDGLGEGTYEVERLDTGERTTVRVEEGAGATARWR